jgi:hypothetical protein
VSEDRLGVLLALIAVPTNDSLPLPARVCRTCVDVISISGAAITLVSRGGHAGTVAASDARSSGVHEHQFTLGEGPGVDAFASGDASLEPDLGAARAVAKWPAFALAAHGVGVAAAFAFPLSLGATRLGALGLYRDLPGPLSEGELVDGSLLATITTLVLVAMQAVVSTSSDELHPQIASSAGPVVVHQATGMAMVQLGVTIAEAFVVLRAYAFAHDRAITDVAADIVARRLVLE